MNAIWRHNEMKTKLISLALALAAFPACAAFTPGEGVANDHALGDKPTDVVFVQRGGGNPYGYRSYDVPIGLTVFNWAAPNFESTVKGLRFNFGWGRHAGMYGLDTGAFGVSGDFAGVSATLFGNYTGNAAGLQVGLVNVVDGDASGVQIGLVNYTERLVGVQIGLLNFARSQWSLPIVNIAW